MDAEAMDFTRIKEIEDRYQLKTYSKYEIALEHGSGSYVYDSQGRKYLDFYGGHAVALTGHCHPRVVRAICEQAGRLMFYSNLVYNGARACAVEALCRFAPPGFKVFLCNSGAEANETALKVARHFTGRDLIIAMEGGFHGRTYGALSVTASKKYRMFRPELGEVEFCRFGDMDHLRALFLAHSDRIAAVILEPVQSMAGVKVAAPEFYQLLRQLCDAQKSLLIFDEVQTAFGRVGTHFFGELVNVCPDMITTAKAVASGFPMGVTFVQSGVADTVKNGEQGTTFGGGPMACAAASATLAVVRDEGLAERARDLGALLREGIDQLSLPGLKEVRQVGLMLGIEFDFEAKPLVRDLLHHGVIVGGADHPYTIRLLPPLTIGEDDCRTFLNALSKVFEGRATKWTEAAHA